jgi:hypothetical protein
MGNDHKPAFRGFFDLRMKRLMSIIRPTLMPPLRTGEMNHDPTIVAVILEKTVKILKKYVVI